ncbi:9069_t:CDS:2 [Diversispora eburnea]|uniref:9069_t:CDS:1 n=1 Tax=Diversispora eburnea TaxID=1213867 RepID=A0A9N8Z5V8_9GLOM|nr:9069_t:CDS:2 [Diversispora eburnea]
MVKAVVISGAGKLFSEVAFLSEVTGAIGDDIARKILIVRQGLKECQESISSVEACDKPVIAAIHNACIGAGVALITACDIRYCSQDAFFSIKEVDLGVAADLGTLQRLPKIVGNDSLVRELCFTGQKLMAEEAINSGLVNKVFKNKEETLMEAIKTATIIASKSPIATLGTKHLLNYSRDHSTRESLEYTAIWNGSMLNTINAFMKKVKPNFAKL